MLGDGILTAAICAYVVRTQIVQNALKQFVERVLN